MAVTPLDLLATLALLALVSGIGGVTYRAVLLLVQLVPPKPHWIERGVVLAVLALIYLGMLALDVPGLISALTGGQHGATTSSVSRTGVLAAWLWTLNTILLMLARGQLGPQPQLRRRK